MLSRRANDRLTLLFSLYIVKALAWGVFMISSKFSYSQCENVDVIQSLPFRADTTTCYSGMNISLCGNTKARGKELAYRYTPSENEWIYIDLLTKSGNTNLKVSLTVLKDCWENNGMCLKVSDDSKSIFSQQRATINEIFLEAGETYFIIISSDISLSKNCMFFDLEINEITVHKDFGRSVCEDDIFTTIPSQIYVNTCENGYDRLSNIQECSNYSSEGKDYVFLFEPQENVCLDYQMRGFSGETQLMIFQNCPTDGVGCVHSDLVQRGEIASGYTYLQQGESYYFWFGSETCSAAGLFFTSHSVPFETLAFPSYIGETPLSFESQTTACKNTRYMSFKSSHEGCYDFTIHNEKKESTLSLYIK